MAKPPNLEQLRELYSTVVNAPLYDLGWQVTANETYLVCEVLDWLLSLAESGGRLVVEQPCQHGNLVEHTTCGRDDEPHDPDNFACVCRGGSRKVVWPTDKEEK